MARNRRYFIKNQVMFLTNRVASGLPFVSQPYMRAILEGIIARAQALYPITICHFLFMGNHYHMVVVCDPELLHRFMEYVNGECAKCINRLRGISNINVWSTRYKCQPILTPDDVVEKIAYLYANPALSDLVDCIDNYPGVSSWQQFTTSENEKTCPWVRSSFLPKAAYGNNNQYLAKSLNSLARESFRLVLEPDAWLHSFEVTTDLDSPQSWNERIIRRIREIENLKRRDRSVRNRHVLGARKLRTQCFFKHFRPRSYGKAMLCICSDRELREQFKSAYKEFLDDCKIAGNKFKRGIEQPVFPPGAFRPPAAALSQMVPSAKLLSRA